jgi:transcriptional regulator with XRE-family HTH domain
MPTKVSAKTDQVPPLRAVREAQGLTLREVARRANVHVAHLSRVERGQAGLSVDALARVAAVLELRSLADLLGQYAKSPTRRRRL